MIYQMSIICPFNLQTSIHRYSVNNQILQKVLQILLVAARVIYTRGVRSRLFWTPAPVLTSQTPAPGQ